METLIIGDIGGQFDALMELTKDHSGPIVLVGDLNDRGPKSKEVIEWAIENESRVTTLHSNHGDMFVEFYKDTEGNNSSKYDPGTFLYNGGDATLESYGVPKRRYMIEEVKKHVPKYHIDWLNTRPMFIELENAIVSHAPAYDKAMYDNRFLLNDHDNYEWFWNREKPIELPVWQIFGHNSHWGYKTHLTDKWICLDSSGQEILTGIKWPSQEVSQVWYKNKNSS